MEYRDRLKKIAGFIGHTTDTALIDKDFKTFLMLMVPKEMRIELYKEMQECEDDSCSSGCTILPSDLELKDSDVI